MRHLLGVISAALALPAGAAGGTLFVLDGGGWGHGVGLSQWGAEGYARHGSSAERILAHYYPGTRLAVVPARPVRVLVGEGLPRVRITSAKPFLVEGRHAKRAVVVTPHRRLPLTFTPGAAPLVLDGRGYRGELVVIRRGGMLDVVNRLPLDRYLRGVVPWEMPKNWHAAAYEAQAIASRSYALSLLGRAGQFDLYADTRDQVYGGIPAERPPTNLAIGATAGRVLTWGGRVARAYYFSSSGGRTAAVRDVWPERAAVPYLVSVPDPYDGISPHHRWIPLPLTPETLGARLGVPAVRDVRVGRATSGWVRSVRIESRAGWVSLPPAEFAHRLGLRSTSFSVRVLALQPPSRWAVHDRPFSLDGFVRGLGRVRLEERMPTGTWRPVTRVRLRPDGRFEATVKPSRTTWYRLATSSAAGAEVRVRVAGR